MAYTFSKPYLPEDCDEGVCGETIAAGQLVARKTDGLLWLANAALNAVMPAIGIAEVDGNATDATRITVVRKCAEMKGASGLTVGAELYVGESAGTITTSRPSTHLDAVQSIGHAKSATTFVFDIGNGNTEQIGITS
jgi:hypothetical protein